MTKKKVKLLTLIFTLIFCFTLLSGCQNENASKTTYTITVMSEGEKSLSDIKVYIYADSKQEDLVWAAETGADGKVSFEAEESDTYVAVLQEVPDGYQVEEFYSISEEMTEIKLENELIGNNDLIDIIYKLGDAIHDFSVIDVNGITYKLSELLQNKKAVILNFWFLNCGPCKMEFPFMQQAYDEYKDKIEIIAINPCDGTNNKILAYAQENGLSFPMAVGDEQWQSWMNISAYPTTVVIDRYGTIGMKHTGMVTDKETFVKIFEYFSSDDYKQTTIRNLDDIK